MPGVFISYRRDDSPGHAGRVFDALRARLGSDLVFMDVQGIDAGVDFVRALEGAVASCDALLAIIGPGWLSSADPDGHRRLHDPDDFVRLEIGVALQRDVRVVPVLVDNARLPTQDELPDGLKALTRRNAVELRDSRWDVDVNELVGSLETFLTGSADENTVFEQHGSAVARSRRRYRWMGAAGVTVLLGTGAIYGLRGRVADSAGDTRIVSASSDAGLRPSSGSREASADTPGKSTARGDAPRRTSHRGIGIGWFGLWLEGVTNNPPGVIVGEVVSGGPAAIAGIVEKDVLVDVAGQSMNSNSAVADAVVHHVQSTPAGTPGVVHVMRNGVPHEFMVFFDREFDLSP